jgi:dihydroorotase
MFTVRNATLADGRTRDVRVDSDAGTVDAVGRDLALDAARSIDADGHLLLPGMIDVHVHFREPGAPHKETWGTGSRSAVAGGVTAAADQPNTDPPTTSGATYDAKTDLARGTSLADFGVNGGVTPDWDPESLLDRPLFALGEVFLADSTGEMGIDADLFRAAVRRAAAADLPVTVHAEDATRFDEAALPAAPTATGRDADADAWSAYRRPEAEVAAAELAAEVAADADARLHLAHTSTPGAADVAADAGLTCEATPHHLFLSREDLPDLGTFGRMNPPLRSERRRAALFDRLADGAIDMVATDHAPHTRAEKETTLTEAPSGVPGVETALPLLLAAADEGRLSYERVRDVTAANPAAVFDLPNKGRVAEGMDADLVLVDPGERTEIRGADLHSKCGWTPFEGFEGVFPQWTALRGQVVYAREDADLPPALAPADGRFGDAAGRNLRT